MFTELLDILHSHPSLNIHLVGMAVAVSEPYKVCLYDKEGTCSLHGDGALKRWGPQKKSINGVDGKTSTKYRRVA